MCEHCDNGQKMPPDAKDVQYPPHGPRYGAVIYWCIHCTAAIRRDLYPEADRAN